MKYCEIKSAAVPTILEWFAENLELCFSDAGLLPMLVAAMSHSQDEHVMKGDENALHTLHSALAKKVRLNHRLPYFSLILIQIVAKFGVSKRRTSA